MKFGRAVALVAFFPAIASAEPAKHAKSRRAPRIKKATAPAQVAAPEAQRPPVPAVVSPRPVGSTVDAPPHPAPAPVVPVVTKEAPAPEPSTGWSRFTLTANPAPMALGRYGGNLEFLPAARHAIVLVGFVQTFPPWMVRRLVPSNVEVGSGPPSRPGGEIGYRFYTGQHGASGLFVGPSAVVMPLIYPRLGQDLRAEVVSFNAYGAALDVGLQAITDFGLTLGGGLGVMYLVYTPPASVTPPTGVTAPTFVQPHVLPRLLFTAGWSFG